MVPHVRSIISIWGQFRKDKDDGNAYMSSQLEIRRENVKVLAFLQSRADGWGMI
jgi:hypothetical protein